MDTPDRDDLIESNPSRFPGVYHPRFVESPRPTAPHAEPPTPGVLARVLRIVATIARWR